MLFVVATCLFFSTQIFAQEKCDLTKIKKYAAEACKGWETEKAKFKDFQKMTRPEILKLVGDVSTKLNLMKPDCSSYVWIHKVDGDKIIMTVHPANPQMSGNDISGITEKLSEADIKKGIVPKTFVKDDKWASIKTKGQEGFSYYRWTKPKESVASTKCSYILNCDSTYAAAIGIYDVEEKDCKVKK